MADLAYSALLLAFVVGLYSILATAVGLRWRLPGLLASGRRGPVAVALLLALATGLMVYLLATHDFQSRYVYSYTSRAMSLRYVLAALWAGNEGSLLLIATSVSVMSAIALHFIRRKHPDLAPYSLMVMMVVVSFYISLMAFLENPFYTFPLAPADGVGLNPLLTNPAMTIHPPLLMSGFMYFTIPFSLGVAGLVTGRVDYAWVTSVRRWLLLAWTVLGLGMIIGAWWAYVEFGWGGYWAWDPVENAAAMPWLLGTALLHSLMVQRHRGILKVWNMALLIMAFHLALLGTFLDRSGVLGSVHAFAQTTQAPVMLGFIGGSLVASMTLLFVRLHVLRGEEQLESLLSREGGFILNNFLIVAVTFVVFWGTMYPLVAEAVRGDRVTVAAPFFNRVNGPLLLTVFVLMGLGPLIAWRRASSRSLVRNLAGPLAAAALVILPLPALGIRSIYPVVGFAVSAFAAGSVFQEWTMGVIWRHRNRRENYLWAFVALFASNRARHGGYLVHLAAALMATAIIGSSFFRTDASASLSPGESLHINQYRLQYQGLTQFTSEGKDVTAATFALYNDEHSRGTVVAAREFHPTLSQPVTEIGLRSTPVEDLYVVLGDWDMSTQRAVFHVEVIPMVMWIWIGGGLFVLGSLIAFWPASQRAPAKAGVRVGDQRRARGA